VQKCPIPIVEDLIPPGRKNRPGKLRNGKAEWITIHDTGNPNPGADARMHALWVKNSETTVSWHFTVDDHGAYQHLPLDEHGWHAGDDQGPGNMQSVGIEICEHLECNRALAEGNAAVLVAWLLAVLGLGIDRVVPHQRWCPRKYCPHLLLPRWDAWICLLREKTTLLVQGTPIVGEPKATIEQARAWARGRQASETFMRIAEIYWRVGLEYGIRPEVAYAQAAKETGFGRFGGVVTPDMNNFCGLKTREAKGDRREDHASFPDPETGVQAHYQHLAAYCGLKPLGKVVDPRYEVVLMQPWAGTVTTVEGLGGKWAPSPDYGRSIVKDYLEPLLATPAQVWSPAAEILRLQRRGIISGEHDPGAAVTWGEFATVLNRILERPA